MSDRPAGTGVPAAKAAGWRPDWTLEPAPKGADEAEVKALYYREAGVNAGLSWRQLQEWQRESWRREYRDA